LRPSRWPSAGQQHSANGTQPASAIQKRDHVNFLKQTNTASAHLGSGQTHLGRVVQEMCDADFTDTRCGLVAATYTVTGSATSVTSRRVFGDTTRTELDGVYTYGILTWTTGNNDGLSSAVKNYTTGEIELVESMPRAITVGDEYSMLKGCSKTRDACVAYSNIVNFRGFPEVPTPNSVSEGP
jgi:uncharacterized phage protein (TIGR02218 family)